MFKHISSQACQLRLASGWKGILIEGIPELYEKCKKQRTNSNVYNCALVSSEFSSSTVKMHYAHLMSLVEGSLRTEEEQRSQISSGIAVQHLDGTYSIDVPARTLESILDEASGCFNIDFFSLDVEGYELEVLKGLNLKKYRPKFILVEARYFDEVNSFLVDHNYEMIDKLSFHDYLYTTR